MGAKRVLFKTRNSSFWIDEHFRQDFTFITPDAARGLVAAHVRLVGIDYLSVEVFKSANHDTHRVLLADDVVILEGLDLSGIGPGVYELFCLPLKLPARCCAISRTRVRDLRPEKLTSRCVTHESLHGWAGHTPGPPGSVAG